MALPSFCHILFSLIFGMHMFGASMGDLQEACSHTLQVDLCLKSLLAYPESRTADTPQLAGLAIRTAANYGEETRSNMYKTIKEGKSKIKKGVKRCFHECLEHLTEVVEQLDIASVAIDSEAYHDVEQLIEDAMTDAKACHYSCKDETGKEDKATALKKKINHLVDLCSVALDLTKTAE